MGSIGHNSIAGGTLAKNGWAFHLLGGRFVPQVYRPLYSSLHYIYQCQLVVGRRGLLDVLASSFPVYCWAFLHFLFFSTGQDVKNPQWDPDGEETLAGNLSKIKITCFGFLLWNKDLIIAIFTHHLICIFSAFPDLEANTQDGDCSTILYDIIFYQT